LRRPRPSTPPPGIEEGAPEAAAKDPQPLTFRILVFRCIGVIAVGLAAAGAVLPLLPTTVFLLIALWAFARGSPKLAERLRTDRRYGPVIRNWEERRAIPVKAKVAAIVAMSASLAIVASTSRSLVVVGLVGAVLAAVAGYIVTRPSA
jgi:uncharacterized membrane protein YbaN (DUF454 family)